MGALLVKNSNRDLHYVSIDHLYKIAIEIYTMGASLVQNSNRDLYYGCITCKK